MATSDKQTKTAGWTKKAPLGARRQVIGGYSTTIPHAVQTTLKSSVRVAVSVIGTEPSTDNVPTLIFFQDEPPVSQLKNVGNETEISY
ncbi:MAG TPA: hypothetical protein PK765_00200 [bacterium]|nr:hypothetical protein [bacterium]